MIAYHVNAPLTIVQYEENREIHSFFDHLQKRITVMNDVFIKVYEKDQFGRNIRLTFEDSLGNAASDYFGYHRYEWSHEANGSITEERFTPDGKPGPLRGSFHFMKTRCYFLRCLH